MKVFLTTGLLFAWLGLLGQSSSNLEKLLSEDQQCSSNFNNLLFLCNQGIEGSRQFREEEDWQDALMADWQDSVYQVKALLHSRENRLEILLGQTVYEVYPEKIQGIRLEDRILVSAEYFAKNNYKVSAFFELLSDGEYRLLKRIEDQLLAGSSFYLQHFFDTAKEIKGGKNGLIRMLKDKRSGIRAYLKEKGATGNKELTFKLIVDFYNGRRAG